MAEMVVTIELPVRAAIMAFEDVRVTDSDAGARELEACARWFYARKNAEVRR